MTLTLCAAALLAADPAPLKSGVPVGGKVGPYSFLVATGPERGQSTCYVCGQGDKPAAVVFARTLSDPLGKLLTKLDAAAADRGDGFKAWATLLTPTADLDALAKWGKDQGLKALPVGAFEDADGPPAYALHRDADVTVVVFAKRKATATFAVRPSQLSDAAIDEIVKSLPPAK